ncbi:poly(R)-hydroxyalkanoic acid synthase subunit PhaE [Aurantibacillus circumpalustris]|uniref:poly(R)-hydroxyalkanoic acid synthase subunit PhaE n=1 Tax=Aurantibacillus circumpalustris TaxID=3036359 RepID=UPI00295A8C1D|nr:poly(R)-hydroxyalkanoic acid synthase subunit PhaE [Aurantibacillus circumpalustris]
MKTSNPVIDTLVESQTQFVNNWMDSAKKMQSAFTSGNISTEGQSLYKEYFDKQMGILNGMQQSSVNMFNTNESNPQEFFKNWFNQQASYAKQMADFNQSINNSFSSFGKPAQDYMANFGQNNTAFTNMYNSWLNTLNSSFDSMSKNMNSTFNKDVFTNFMQGSRVYANMQEFFQPMASMFKNGQFNMDAFKNQFTADAYANLTKQMFGNMYGQSSVQEVYDNGMKQLQNFFANQNNLGKEYYAQIQNISKDFPKMFEGNAAITSMKDFQAQFHNVFGKTFEPLMKLVNAGKEKENAEAIIALMDRMGDYSIKQAELQSYLQNTAKKGVEEIAQHYSEKYANPKSFTEMPSAQDMYAEWVKVNEKLFTELFASEEFSKVKGEALNLSMDVKKHFEKQFESTFSNMPVVFKSEIEELQKTIYDLKKQVKDLQAKGGAVVAAHESDDDKASKTRKK